MKPLAAATAAVLAASAGGVPAQDLLYSDEHTASCLEAGEYPDARKACIGVSANACMEDSPGGFTTVGMAGCLSLELDYWDRRLNASYRDLMRRERRDDAEMAGTGAPSRAQALRAMQRAWIPFRDASCAYARAQWGGGTGGGPAELGCLLQMTAEQTLALEDPAGGN